MPRTVMSYTKIPLEKLDYIRLELRAKLKRLEAETGVRYAIRTFYCGHRTSQRTRWNRNPASTNKANATAAKIGIYKVSLKQWHSDYISEYRMLDRYI